jgi:hypothetical protein
VKKSKPKLPSRAGVAPELTPERWRRGDVERLPQAVADEAGHPSRPYRVVDTLAAMQRRGTITASMRQSADHFHAQFVLASLDPLRAADLNSIRGAWRDVPMSLRQAEARTKVWQALQALGGIASPSGSCIWHVVGCEWTIKDWALREGWGGRPLSQETAAGILVGGLGVLQGFYGH